ncbi:MAG: hypothetical protein P8J87_17530, partial [Verrucomicrobiales bacterium]|nr:hypothetical protein [Verrucomicrobiales bacterium]
TAQPHPTVPGASLPVTVSFAQTANTGGGGTWHLYGFTNHVVSDPVPAEPEAKLATVTSDNHVAVYLGRADGSNLRLMGRDTLSDWQSPERFLLNYQPGDHIYVVSWDNPGAINDPQMWLGDFDLPDGSVLGSNALDWETYLGPLDSNPGNTLAIADLPAITELQDGITTANTDTWELVGESLPNTSGPWGPNPGISTYFFDSFAEFIWYDTAAGNVSFSNDDETYTVYRTTNLIAEGVGVSLDGNSVPTGASQGDTVGTLSTYTSGAAETFTIAFADGDGDTDNAKFQLVGSQLQAAAYDFSTDPESTVYSVLISATGDTSGNSDVRTFAITSTGDNDNDNLLDTWELRWAADLTSLSGTGGANADGDTLTDAEEFQISQNTFPDINPLKADSDDDTLTDDVEIAGSAPRPPTDPTKADTDGDSLPDNVESNTGIDAGPLNTGTNPVLADTDGDFYPDGTELARNSDPLDGLSVPAPVLVAYWPFDADVPVQPDSSGLGHHATAAPDANWVDDPERGGVMDFFGTDDSYLETPDTDALSITSDITIMAWVSLIDFGTGGERGIVGKSNVNLPAPYDFYLWGGSGAPRLYSGNGQGIHAQVSGLTTPLLETWEHVAVVRQGDVVTHYLNGQFDNDGILPANVLAAMADADKPLRIGNRDDFATDMNGRLDDVAIFDGALTEQQINTLMAGDFSAWIAGGPAGTPLAITSVSRDPVTREVSLTWSSTAGKNYRLEVSNDAITWNALEEPIPATSTSTNYTDALLAPNTPGGILYYRVREL